MFLKYFDIRTWEIRFVLAVLLFFVFILFGFEPIPSLIMVLFGLLINVIIDVATYRQLDCPNAVQKKKSDLIRCRLRDDCTHQRRCPLINGIILSEDYYRCPGKNKKPKFSLNIFKKKNK